MDLRHFWWFSRRARERGVVTISLESFDFQESIETFLPHSPLNPSLHDCLLCCFTVANFSVTELPGLIELKKASRAHGFCT